ncbi:hypothetical protein SUGI_0046140 [Cryptomeria japonica]|uniref:uncharacterized protein LOC131043584 n=1 Tax=Cryptomeria japonica TaxID=3369 RepID=UPI002408D145|nr:uncharacterized protein LOC131043584 [Cryptomeria japonica]GLJ06719.1 hypothetical protein SUGI_0046140 [Cryptomeria japonica]
MMKNSSCVAGCLDAQAPTRATFESIHRWPHSEAEFVRVMRSKDDLNPKRRAEYVDGYSCRQMYLRSYTFSRKETVPQKTKKCFGKVKDRMSTMVNTSKKDKRASLLRKIRDKIVERYCAAMAAIFHRLLSCTTSVEVSDQALNYHHN